MIDKVKGGINWFVDLHFFLKLFFVIFLLIFLKIIGLQEVAKSFILLLAAWGGYKFLFDNDDSKSSNEGYRRGSIIVNSQQLSKQIKKSKLHTHSKIGDVPIPTNIEPQHFIFVGGTGTGKSLAFSQLQSSARQRNQKAILIDLNGAALQKYFREGDVILNPFDARSQAWSFFSEIQDVWQIDSLSKSLIPDGSGNEGEWNLYAQNVLSMCLQNLWQSGRGDNQNLISSLLTDDLDSLRQMSLGTPAQRIFEAGAERMLQSVLSIVGSKVTSFKYLPNAGKNDFSIRKWMQTKDDSWLFINVRDDQLASLKPLIACWLDIAISSLLSSQPLPPSSDERVWFFVDELASLGRVQSIEPLLTKSRKFGGAVVAGLQSISQLESSYGRFDAQTILSNFSSQLVLRQNDSQTAEHFSKTLGDQEVERILKSASAGEHSSNSWSTQIATQKLILPSQLTNLPDRYGYLKLCGNWPVSSVTIPIPKSHTKVAEAFLPR